MFLAIFLSTYITLRKKTHLLVEAKAVLLREESKKFLDKIFNLIFFRFNSNIIQDSLEYLRLNSQEKNDVYEQTEINEMIKKLGNSILQQSKVNYFQIFKYNLFQLSMLNKGSSIVTREQYLQKIKNCVETIKIQKAKHLKYRDYVENLVDHNFHLLKNLVICAVYIFFFVFMVIMRIRITESYKLHQINYSSLYLPEYAYRGENQTLSDLRDVAQCYGFMEQVLIPIFENHQMSQNYWIGGYRARITFNNYKFKTNENSFSSSAMPFYVPEKKEMLTDNFYGNSTRFLYQYHEKGDGNTYDRNGGYVLELTNGTDYDAVYTQISADNLIGGNNYQFIIE